jgi:hypothetical protein
MCQAGFDRRSLTGRLDCGGLGHGGRRVRALCRVCRHVAWVLARAVRRADVRNMCKRKGRDEEPCRHVVRASARCLMSIAREMPFSLMLSRVAWRGEEEQGRRGYGNSAEKGNCSRVLWFFLSVGLWTIVDAASFRWRCAMAGANNFGDSTPAETPASCTILQTRTKPPRAAPTHPLRSRARTFQRLHRPCRTNSGLCMCTLWHWAWRRRWAV